MSSRDLDLMVEAMAHCWHFQPSEIDALDVADLKWWSDLVAKRR
ncbi:hypothetical protein [Kaistia sp. MMO-174]